MSGSADLQIARQYLELFLKPHGNHSIVMMVPMSRHRNLEITRFQFLFQYPTSDWVYPGPQPFSVGGTKYYAVDDMALTLMYEETT
ncbi:MAG: hypothetical protein RKR03_11955 [Candidatus Competibacter sp.]|nr:hypothetical protein [Candidatus Competibacter sp.]